MANTTVTGSDVATTLLQDLNAPVTPATTRAVSLWLTIESGGKIVRNNPWNIEGTGNCGSDSYNGRQFAVYCSLNDGIAATAKLLTNYSGYSGIVRNLRLGSVSGFFAALVSSPWDGTHYAGLGGTTGFLSLFNGSVNYAGKTFTVVTPGSSGTSGTPTGTTVSDTSNNFANALDQWVGKYVGTGTTWNDAIAKATAFGGTGITADALAPAFAATGVNPANPINSTDYNAVRTWLINAHPNIDLNPFDALGKAIAGIEYGILFLAFILVGIVLLIVGSMVSRNVTAQAQG